MLENKQKAISATDANIYHAYTVYIEAGSILKMKYSPSCLTITGYTEQEFSEDPDLWINIVAQEDRDLIRQQAADLLSGHFPQPIEYGITRKGGTVRRINALAIPQYDINDNLTSYCALVSDITESKKAEKNLYTYTRGLAVLLEVNKSIAATLDLENVLQASVDGVTKLIGLDTSAVYLYEDEMLHLRATAPPLPAEYPEELRNAPLADHPHIRKAITSGKPVYVHDILKEELTGAEQSATEQRDLRTIVYIPLVIRTKAIGVFILSSIAEPKLISDIVINLSCTLANLSALAVRNAQLHRQTQDNTAQLEQILAEREKLLKTLSTKNKELESIVYVTSHDLKSPLVNISCFSTELANQCKELETLVQTSAPADTKNDTIETLLNENIPESLQFITAGTNKIQMLLNGLLQVSRIGTDAINIQTIDMNALFGDIVKTFESKIRDCGAAITLDDLPPCQGDLNKISQVFSNLFDNALKYLDPNRPPKIHISGQADDCTSTYCVQDNGIGIAPEHINRIFEVFHRLDPNDDVGGEGLGLSIVMRILDRLNGTIRAESEPGQGSKFFVTLPTVKV